MNSRRSGLCAVLALAIIFLCLADSFLLRDPQHAAEALANRRIRILRSAFQGRITREAAEESLRQLESESLLRWDLQALKSGKDEGKGPADETMGLGRLRSIRQKNQYYQYTTYEAELGFAREGEGKSILYNLVLKRTGDTFTLTIFEPAEV